MATKLVKLFRDHTHQGKLYKAGETVELPDWAADYVAHVEVRTRIETREAAAKIPGTPEYEAAKAAAE